ncbi:hypothetical protein SAMN05444374_1233 [Rhodococcoides kroppenstedtii]|uniref:Uncharacterized protein n=1 Tax=Rhodococcoides kroppenstedtii TaxID=293050 RepID=A0A1I0UEK9_9NOCA|nr:DUF6338 family protein [Rhodococcus kroppenstedtii]SFA62471.1 hypothetical protein SAMN05444374_1233 [Rhodococcus kroppenstedtii]
MPSSFQAVAAFIVALVPGALYFWSYERIAGRWGANLTDRLFRFLGASALFHAVLAPATYWFWAEQWPHVVAGDRLSFWLWPAVLAYVVVPLLGGTIVGYGTRDRTWWATIATGPDPAPRAWDHLFHGKRDGWVRLKLKSGTWIGGAYATSDEDNLMSYTAGYPEDQDLFLSTTIDVDPDSGEFILDDDGRARVAPRSGLLVRWEEVEYLQFIRIDVLPAEPGPRTQSDQGTIDHDDEGTGDATAEQYPVSDGP